jgi:hypothetical protein
MTGKHLFDYFGLPYDASIEDVKKRYRVLVKKYHPDRNKSKNANVKFQELHKIYEELLTVIKNRQSVLPNQIDDSPEEQWKKYRERARSIRLEKQRKQAEAMNLWYDQLQSGKILKYTRFVTLCSTILLMLLTLDIFLPTRYVKDSIVRYSTKIYHTIDEHRISKIETANGENLWLDRYNNGFFSYNPFVQIEKTRILHSPISIHKYDEQFKKTIPIELTVYWAQIMVFIALLIPVFFYFYRVRDIFLIMGSYFTRYFVGPFIVWFLFSNDRWIHLFTFGFL